MNTKSPFPSDLFIQPGDNKPVISDDLSEQMIGLYRAAGIFAAEGPVRNTVKRLRKLNPAMVYPMHGSPFDGTLFPKYADALIENDFAFSGQLLGRAIESNAG